MNKKSVTPIRIYFFMIPESKNINFISFIIYNKFPFHEWMKYGIIINFKR